MGGQQGGCVGRRVCVVDWWAWACIPCCTIDNWLRHNKPITQLTVGCGTMNALAWGHTVHEYRPHPYHCMPLLPVSTPVLWHSKASSHLTGHQQTCDKLNTETHNLRATQHHRSWLAPCLRAATTSPSPASPLPQPPTAASAV